MRSVTNLGQNLPFGYFLLSIFSLNKQFQRLVCDTYFNIQKQFDATIILSFVKLAAVLATFLKIWRFFRISGHSVNAGLESDNLGSAKECSLG